jgi:hypothetical protein
VVINGNSVPAKEASPVQQQSSVSTSAISDIEQQIREAQAEAIRNAEGGVLTDPSKIEEEAKKILQNKIEQDTESTEAPKYNSDDRIDEKSREVVETPNSTAFTEISYSHSELVLSVVFRNSGVRYYYYDVSPEVWNSFKNADSKGGFFNSDIKGYYEYKRD